MNWFNALCWMWPLRAVKGFMHPSLRKRRVENSSSGEEEGRSRGRLTDGLSEWIIDRSLLTNAASINSSKPAWWIAADKQCWVSKCVFNKARWKYCCFFSEFQTLKHAQHYCLRRFFQTCEGLKLSISLLSHKFLLLSLDFFKLFF